MLYSLNFSPLTVPKENLAADKKGELETFQLGVWKVSVLKSSPLNLRKQFSDLKDALRCFKRLAIDVYTLEPILATLFVFSKLWSGVQSALLLYFSSHILRMVRVSPSLFYIELTLSREGRNRFDPGCPRCWSHSQGPCYADFLRHICSSNTMGKVNSRSSHAYVADAATVTANDFIQF